MDNIHWRPQLILPYQRNFNLINGERSIGKSYGTQYFCIDKAITKGIEFASIVRTKTQKEDNVLQQSFEKVIANEFKKCRFEFTKDIGYFVDGSGDVTNRNALVHCFALSEYQALKNLSFPRIKYFIFDEYMLEKGSKSKYFDGWKEPDRFLNIYHTVDREEDRVICFMLGNNTSFYNPYHMHKAFNIPNIDKGELWYSKNVLFQWADSSHELKQHKSSCKFLEMIDDTEYGSYASKGNYIDDNLHFIMPLAGTARHTFIIIYDGIPFGVWNDIKNGYIYVSDKVDMSCKLQYALNTDSHRENTMLTKTGSISTLKWLATNYKLGNVRFTSMEVKIKAEKGVISLC